MASPPPLGPNAAPTFDEALGDAPVHASPTDAALEERALLGRGGLGEVVECFDPELRRVVALKRALDGSPGASAALLREAQVTAQLVHPSVPAVYAVGTDPEGRPWFTMTRLRGRTLADALRDGLDRSTAWRVRALVQIAQAVTYAHSRGVLHRDLKPANVFLGEFGEVSVMDWGIAKVRGAPDDERAVHTSVPHHTAPGRFAGSAQYAAPEQLRGEVDLDERVDVYALGALLFTLLSGRAPVEGDTAASVRQRVLAGQVADPAEVEGLPPALGAVIRRAMALDRADRYPSPSAMTADLEAWLDGRAVSSFDEGHASRLGRWYHDQIRGVSRMDVDLFVVTGGALGVFAMALLLWTVPHEPLPEIVVAGAAYLAVGSVTIRKTALLWHVETGREVHPRVFVFLATVGLSVLAVLLAVVVRGLRA